MGPKEHHSVATEDPAAAAGQSRAQRVREELPYLRRYARALTGDQESGDHFTVVTLEKILADRTSLDGGSSPRVALFRTFHAVWVNEGALASGSAGVSAEPTQEARVRMHVSGLTPNSREALLLSTLEEFSPDEIGEIMDIALEAAGELVQLAHREMQAGVRGRVMIIEDEALIALDLATIVEELGHSIVGVARTVDEAIALGRSAPPDLILSDMQLADDSCGLDAVNLLVGEFGARPVIFITAFPERLLTGDKPEPALLITKPFRRSQVALAISQGMFFASMEKLLV